MIGQKFHLLFYSFYSKKTSSKSYKLSKQQAIRNKKNHNLYQSPYMFMDRCRESQMCRLKQIAMQGPTAFWGYKRRVHWGKNACYMSIKPYIQLLSIPEKRQVSSLAWL